MKTSSLILVGVAGLAWVMVGATAQEKIDKSDTQAKEAAEQFMKAMKAEDIEAVMKAAVVPFFLDGKRNIKDREELKRVVARVFEEKDLTAIEYTVKENYAFSKAPENLLNKMDQELLKEVLRSNDRVVLVELKRDWILVLVQVGDGKPKIAGFRD